MKKRILLLKSRDAYTLLKICSAIDKKLAELEIMCREGKLQTSYCMQMRILVYDFCEDASKSIEAIVSQFQQVQDPARLRAYIQSVQHIRDGKAFHYKTYSANTPEMHKLAVSMDRIEVTLHSLEKVHAISPEETRAYRECSAHIKAQANNILLDIHKIIHNTIPDAENTV